MLPHSTDRITKAVTRLGLDVIFRSLEETEKTDPLIKPPITVSSSHTKHALEDLHPNIAVFRHPDHLPDRQNIAASFVQSFQNIKLTAASASKMPGDALKAIYGMNEDSVLYWAHHEKLCLVDGRIAFMGGLDLCYGRWDTNHHSIADAHPGDLNDIVFPGQDYNNSRIMDFDDVTHWQNNKLDRTKSSRMGWSDISLSLVGPAVEDLKEHFVQRWNFVYNEKYTVRKDDRYSLLKYVPAGQLQPQQGQDPIEAGAPRAEGESECEYGERGLFTGHEGGLRDKLKHRVEEEYHKHSNRWGVEHQVIPQGSGPFSCQITRSASKWSHGISLEVSYSVIPSSIADPI
jgi:phospholipase D1/2